MRKLKYIFWAAVLWLSPMMGAYATHEQAGTGFNDWLNSDSPTGAAAMISMDETKLQAVEVTTCKGKLLWILGGKINKETADANKMEQVYVWLIATSPREAMKLIQDAYDQSLEVVGSKMSVPSEYCAEKGA